MECNVLTGDNFGSAGFSKFLRLYLSWGAIFYPTSSNFVSEMPNDLTSMRVRSLRQKESSHQMYCPDSLNDAISQGIHTNR